MPKKKKGKKGRLIIFGIPSLVAIAYFITNLVTYAYNIKDLKKQEKNLTTELNTLKKDSDNLKTEIEKLKDPEYIARYAREEYSYSKENGEYIIKINEKEEEKKEEEKKDNNTNKYLFYGLGIGLLGVIIYIRTKWKINFSLS